MTEQRSVIPTQYAIHVWCDENGAHGTYCVGAFSEDEARAMVAEAFREQCICAAAFHVPEVADVRTEIVR